VSPPEPSVALDRTLDAALGFEHTERTDELARGRFAVEDRVRQPFGAVHGGAYAAMADTLASAATAAAVEDDGDIAMAQSIDMSLLRPAAEGFVHAEARRRHGGRTSWVWDVDLTDDAGRLCAIARVTVAVRPRPS
jgi:1,4-dihydroxy-2-naphthoyl-CoA hydrolase